MANQGCSEIPSTIIDNAHVCSADRLHADPQRDDIQQDKLPVVGGDLPVHQLQVQRNLYN